MNSMYYFFFFFNSKVSASREAAERLHSELAISNFSSLGFEGIETNSVNLVLSHLAEAKVHAGLGGRLESVVRERLVDMGVLYSSLQEKL